MKETLEELKVLFRKVNDKADEEITRINFKIESLKEQKDEVEYARNHLLSEIRQKIDEKTKEKYEKEWLN